MGIFDSLSNLSPDQTQGILAAAAQMLQQSGPSRLPVGLGQIAGGGLQAFQTGSDAAQQRRMQLEQAQQAAQLHGLQIQGLTGELQDKQLGRDRQMKIRSDLSNLLQQQGSPAAAAPSPMGQPQVPQIANALPGGPMSPKIGGPDWLQAYQAQQPAGAGAAPSAQQVPNTQPQQSLGSSSNSTEAYANRLLKEAEVYSKNGDFAGADQRYQAASKLLPQVDKVEPATDPQSGKLVNVITFKDGSQKVSAFGVKPDFKPVDQGGKITIQDYNALAPGQSFTKSMTPGEISSANQAAARLKFDKEQAAGNQDTAMDPLAVRLTAQQYLAGDTSALQNFGRGAQGAQNLNAVRLEITKQANAAGLNGADIAARVAEFGGIKAGQRTAGTRSANIEIAANEAAQLAPLALDASAKVARSGFLPFGKAQLMFDTNTNNPDMRQFAMANTALVNAYGQVMSRGGKATDSDKKHASELLSTAFDQPSYAAAVSQLQQEIQAARTAPGAVRKDLNNSVSGSTQPSQNQKTVTLADIAVTAQKSGKTTAEVTKALRDQGYTIGGQ